MIVQFILSATVAAAAPLGLLTPDFGIVTADDLAYDSAQMETTPYDPKGTLGSLHWQCVPGSAVSAGYKSWRGMDGAENSTKLFKMCSLEVRVRNNGVLHLYVDHRGHRLDYCKMFIREWSKVASKEDVICVNGDHSGAQTDKEDGAYQLWTWQKVKTKKGCYSFFADQCNTRGCADGKCPD